MSIKTSKLDRSVKPKRRGPHRADQVREGEPYEVSHGYAIECMATSGRSSRANLLGGAVLGTDPDVDAAGVDTGYSPDPYTLRAPDVAVGGVPDQPGWVSGVPPLAVEYADTGQDEAALRKKIVELLGAGTRQIWVVRMIGPRRVEVHEPGVPMRVVAAGGLLTAPGILRNPVRVEELYDRDAAEEAILRNLLQRNGYESLEEVKAEGKAEGLAEGKAEGLAKGKAEGLAEGKAEGLAEGKAAERAELVRRMAEQGLGAGQISQLTSIELAEVRRIVDVPVGQQNTVLPS